LLALLASLLPALSSERTQRFAFALPEEEGRISLGVFDSSGKLVRTLCVGADESDFVVGLNGLIGTWDGKDDLARPLPAGNYQIRGYLVGDALKTEGVAYHFNDWIDDEKSPRIIRIDDFARYPGGFVILAQVSNSQKPAVFRFDQLRGFIWTNLIDPTDTGIRLPGLAQGTATKIAPPVQKRLLATSVHHVALWSAPTLYLLRMDDGTSVKARTEGLANATYIAANNDNLFLGALETITRITLPELDVAGEEKTPLAFGALAIDGEHKLAASSGSGEVWEATNAEWKKLPVAAAVSELSFGLRGTFWVTAVDAENHKPFVGQFDKAGEFLRAYRDDFSPLKVCASTAIEEIAVLEASGSVQRLRVLSLVEENSETPGNWTIVFEKTIQDCRRFGIVEGKLVPDAGSTPQSDQIQIPLATGGLTSSSPTVTLRLAFDKAGLWLETSSGLRLAFLASQPNVRRVTLLLAPENKSLTVYAGDDAVVAEYKVRGLRDLVEIDVGEVELP
jgi:FlgD Ig-like domain